MTTEEAVSPHKTVKIAGLQVHETPNGTVAFINTNYVSQKLIDIMVYALSDDRYNHGGGNYGHGVYNVIFRMDNWPVMPKGNRQFEEVPWIWVEASKSAVCNVKRCISLSFEQALNPHDDFKHSEHMSVKTAVWQQILSSFLHECHHAEVFMDDAMKMLTDRQAMAKEELAADEYGRLALYELAKSIDIEPDLGEHIEELYEDAWNLVWEDVTTTPEKNRTPKMDRYIICQDQMRQTGAMWLMKATKFSEEDLSLKTYKEMLHYFSGADKDDPEWNMDIQPPNTIVVVHENTPSMEDAYGNPGVSYDNVPNGFQGAMPQQQQALDHQHQPQAPVTPLYSHEVKGLGVNNLYSIKVAGVSFDNRQEVCSKLKIGNTIQLKREPDNPYDCNAIKVLYENNQFGYIPKEIAQDLADVIDNSRLPYRSLVTNITRGEYCSIGVCIDIIFHEGDAFNLTYRESNPNDKNSQNVSYEDLINSAIISNSSHNSSLKKYYEYDGVELDHVPTYEQKGIIEYKLQFGETIKVIAFAGTGKTTTLLDYTKIHKNKKFLYVAFNSSVQKSANKKFPSNVHCRTSHSLAFEKFGWRYKNSKGIINNIKLNEIKDALRLEDYGDAGRVFAIFSNFLSSSDDNFSAQLLNKNPDNVSDVDYQHLAIAKQLWEKMIDPSDKSIGMLHDGYLKLYQLSKPILDYDCILLDEAQDTNPVVTDIVIRQKCAKILVGDSHQQIYSFRGALDAIAKIQASKTFYLTKSFRFGPEIAWIANKILKIYKNEQVKLIGGKEEDSNFKETFGIIARTNAMIFDQAVCNCDKKITFLGGFNGYHFNDIMDVYNLYINKKKDIQNPYIRHNFETYKQLIDYAIQVDDLELKSKCKVVEKYTDSIPSLIVKIKNSIVKEQDAEIVLTTAHKAKGAQFDTVKICDDFPSFFDDSKKDVLQPISGDEANLLYVAVTRAKQAIRFSDYIEWRRFIKHEEEINPINIILFIENQAAIYKPENKNIVSPNKIGEKNTYEDINSDDFLPF